MTGGSMKGFGERRRHRVAATVGTSLVLVLSGCGTGGGDDLADGSATAEPDGDDSAMVDGTAGEDPCGDGGDGEVPGPPGEPPADGASPVTVTAVEYAFDDVEVDYPAGDHAFTLANEGAELHEVILLRIREDGVTFDDLMAMSDEEAEAAIDFVGGAVACPGDTAEPFGATLEPGRYVLACFLPVGSTPGADPAQLDGPPHAEEGMVHEIVIS
jgi:hypothetical protein